MKSSSAGRGLWINFLFILKKWNRSYSALRDLKNRLFVFIRNLTFFFARIIFARSPNRGPASGIYSIYPLVVQEELRGRIVLEDQGKALINGSSIMEVSKLDQNAEQPWPVFWSRLKFTRLFGVGLAPLNHRKEVCLEAIYGRKHFKYDLVWNYSPISEPLLLPGRWTKRNFA